MKIAMVYELFYPFLGGIEIHMLNLSLELIKKGHSVCVICKRHKGETAQYIYKGIQIIRVSSYINLYETLKRIKFDIVHAHMSRKIYSLLSILFAKFLGYKVVFTPHCFYPSKSLIDWCKKALFDISLGRLSFACVDRMINLTENDRNDAVRLGLVAKKSIIIPNSINVDKFVNYVSKTNFKEKYKLSRYLLYVGRIDWVKNIDFVIKSLPYIDKKIKFVVLGQDTGYKKRLVELANKLNVQNRVIWVGKVIFDELIAAYKDCLALVLPSLYEGLPTVVLEAMSFGKCVISARTGGTQYLISDKEDGFLYEFGNQRNFIQAVNFVSNMSIEKYSQMSKKMIEKVNSHYRWEVNSIRVLNLYKQLAAI